MPNWNNCINDCNRWQHPKNMYNKSLHVYIIDIIIIKLQLVLESILPIRSTMRTELS